MHSWKHIYGYLGTRMRRRVHARAVALLTPRPSLRVPRREMIVEPSPATSSILTAYPLTQPGHIRGGSRGHQGQGGVCHPLPSSPTDIGCAADAISCAIGLVCRSGKRRMAHELVSRHPNMLGICVGGNGLMIGIPPPAVLLEKNPGSSSSALLHGSVDPGSARWG